MNNVLRCVLSLGLVLLTAACAGGYSQYYAPSGGLSAADLAARRVAPPPETPALVQVSRADGDPDAAIGSYAQRGYALIGMSSFNSSQRQRDADAVAQGKRVGADLVLVLPPHYTGSATDYVPVDRFGPADPYWGPRFGPGFGPRPMFGPHPGPWAWGPGSHFGGWAGFYGPYDWYGPGWVPVTVDYNDYVALYLVQVRWRFGAMYRNLNDGERRAIQSNKGVSVTVIVNGSPAYLADILPGDVITAIDGQTVFNAEDFGKRIEDASVKSVRLTIYRSGETVVKTVPLAF